jgi:hypothetical protein
MGAGPGEREGPLFDNVLLEESSADEGGSSGLELDPKQAAEIRQIFLTTLPDYLTPIKEMVVKLSSEPDADGQIRGALSKTIASIAEAATRVKLADVAASMQALREDVILLGDPGEPQAPLNKRIATALAALDDLARAGGAAEADAHREAHGETIVAALGNIDGVDGGTLQKLVAAGVIYVDQLCDADPKEIVMVSGLDALTVATLVRLARETRSETAPGNHPSPTAVAGDVRAPLAPPNDVLAGEQGDPSRRLVRMVVDDELALDEARGEALRLRLTVEALRAEASAIERQCDNLKSSGAETRERAAERAGMLTKAIDRRSRFEREHASILAELEETAQRLGSLQAERLEAIAELERLAGETSSVTVQVEHVLEGQEAHEGK